VLLLGNRYFVYYKIHVGLCYGYTFPYEHYDEYGASPEIGLWGHIRFYHRSRQCWHPGLSIMSVAEFFQLSR
jgi:hypothetical protein